MSMNVKNCGNCDHFSNTRGYYSICHFDCLNTKENTNINSYCDNFKLSTVTSEQINTFLELTRKENF